MSRDCRPFAERLAEARRFMATVDELQVPPLPPGFADQLQAAAAEADEFARRFAAVWPYLAGPVTSGEIVDGDGEVRARLFVALGGCLPCVHLRRQPAQVAYVLLGTHRVDCERCVLTVVNPPADEDDRCDFCGGRGNEFFTGTAFRHGAMFVHGDACDDCAPWFRGALEDGVAS